MKVSVVMAVYNGERHLRESIESILCQTFTDFEFIIVDDGSTDKTPLILKEYTAKDGRIRVVTKEHSGLTLSLIRGVAEARGEYIARQDADDVSDSCRLAYQHATLACDDESNSWKISVVGCGWLDIGENGKSIGARHLFGHDFLWPKRMRSAFKERNLFVHGSLMFRRSTYNLIGGYGPSFKYAQDYDLILRLLEHGNPSVADPENANYRLRLRSGSISLLHGREQKKCAEAARLLNRARNQKPCAIDKYYYHKAKRLAKGFSMRIIDRVADSLMRQRL